MNRTNVRFTNFSRMTPMSRHPVNLLTGGSPIRQTELKATGKSMMSKNTPNPKYVSLNNDLLAKLKEPNDVKKDKH